MQGTPLNYFSNSKNMEILKSKTNKLTLKTKTISMASMIMTLPMKNFNSRNGKSDNQPDFEKPGNKEENIKWKKHKLIGGEP